MLMNTKNRNNSVMRRSVQILLMLTLLAYPLLSRSTNDTASAARAISLKKAGQAMANRSSVGQNYQTDDIKVLAQGFHSKITKPFVAVVRDTETYAALTRLDGDLPKLDADFFKESVAVAAFLGERNTGGYSVDIRANAIEILVLEKKPGKGVMVPQMITSPFKIVALKKAPNSQVRLNLFADDSWRPGVFFYRVANGRFKVTGGFAGTSEEFGLEGPIVVMRAANLATFSFLVVGSETKKRRLLVDCATGLMDRNGNVKINRMSADSLVNPPNSGLEGTVTFKAEGRKFTLTMSSRPSLVADGYSGQGTIEAELGTPTTNRWRSLFRSGLLPASTETHRRAVARL
jgi:protease stability complex PrcB-like protein